MTPTNMYEAVEEIRRLRVKLENTNEKWGECALTKHHALVWKARLVLALEEFLTAGANPSKGCLEFVIQTLAKAKESEK